MNKHYTLIAEAISFLSRNYREQPGLEELSAQLGVSAFHVQRIFREWVGISPKRFVQFLTIGHARRLLDESRSVLETAYESGMTGPGRLHDLFVTVDAVTPGEYKARGKGLRISYGLHQSPFGRILLATTERGICGLSFHDNDDWKEGLHYLQKHWMHAHIYENPDITEPLSRHIFSQSALNSNKSLRLFLNGTNFQLKVWEALLRIPEGYICSYHDIARWIGRPEASRAVGNAVGANPVSFIIPCHRVIQNSGLIGNYHWGEARKKAMLVWESSKRHP